MALSAKGFPIPVAKRCTKCRDMKAIGEFSKCRARDDGHQYVCKACEREYNAANAERRRERAVAYRVANADRRREYNAAYRAANADRERERNAAYYVANADRYREYRATNADRERERTAAWYAANRDRVREWDAAYRAANADRLREYHAAWRAANRDREREIAAAWRVANPDKVRASRARRRARKRGARTEPYSRSDIFARWGGQCAYCDSPAEHLDHVTALSRGGDDVESNLVPACAPCNLSKNAKSLAEWAATF